MAGVSQHFNAIAACARWESEYILEWLAYHQSIGFQHVYLYCNDDDPRQLYEKVEPLTRGDRPFVTFIHYPFVGLQSWMYKHFLKHHAYKATWFTFLDIDEFVALKSWPTVSHLIRAYDDICDGIYLHWVFFGTSGFVERPSGSVLTQYTRRADKVSPFTKVITRYAALDVSAVLSRGETGFWHSWQPRIRGRMRLKNILRDDIAAYEQDAQTAEAYLCSADRQNRMLQTAVIHHYAFRSERDLQRRIDRGTGGDFFGQLAFKKVLDSDDIRAFLDNFSRVEDASLKVYWERHLAAASCFGIVPCPPGRNLSLGKPATQSSVSRWSNRPMPEADAAGGVNGVFTGRFGFCTDQEDSPWWQVNTRQPLPYCADSPIQPDR